MKCSHCRILIMIFVINLVWNSQNLTQEHSVIDPLNILEPNFGICSHLTWKVLMTCMYSKAIYTNCVSRNMHIRFLRRWIYSNNFSVWLNNYRFRTFYLFYCFLIFYYNHILFIPSTFILCLRMGSNAVITVPIYLYHLSIYMCVCIFLCVCN